MASNQANKRLTKEYKHIVENPVDFITTHPSESNILEWHYIITGPKDTPFQGGQYHGVLVFPPQYPFKPPAIKMITPNGRFASSQRLCLSMSDYHPETWNPAWRVSTILTALVSFMTSEEIATGCVRTKLQTKKELAQRSWQFNKNNPIFRIQFPDHIGKPKPNEETKVNDVTKLNEIKTTIKPQDKVHKKPIPKKAKVPQPIEVIDDDNDLIILDDDKPSTDNSNDPIVID